MKTSIVFTTYNSPAWLEKVLWGFFAQTVKDFEIIDFNKNSNFSLQSTIMFFLIFQVVDYYMEDGFIGMISQWFLYWIMGIIALLLMQIINYYKNYKMIQQRL